MELKHDYMLEFDPTPVGTTVKKSICIHPELENAQIVIEPINTILIIPFRVSRQGRNNEFFIKYSPTVPHAIHDHYFWVQVNEEQLPEVLYVRGICTGLYVQASIRELLLYRLIDDKKVGTSFLIENFSNTAITFHFDLDNTQKLFHVDKMFGRVDAGRHVFVHVKFVMKKPGKFVLPLTCLIHHHSPLFIMLRGINAVNLNKSILEKLRLLPFTLGTLEGYEKYTKPYFGNADLKIVCTFSKRYMNFRSHPGSSSQVGHNRFNNCSAKCMLLKWDLEEEPNFHLLTKEQVVRPDLHIDVLFTFEPTERNTFFGAMLYGKVQLFDHYEELQTQEDDILCPQIPVIMNLIGDSFNGTNNWYPLYDLPMKKIALPVCSDLEYVYATFMLHRKGHLPLIFELFPPNETRFTVRPMQGVVRNEYQIFVVRFVPAGKRDGPVVITEKWRLQFNQMELYEETLTFQVIAESPAVMVGHFNEVTFRNIYPRCQQFLSVPVKNLSRLCLEYKFENNKWINIENNQGILNNHETIYLTWRYTANLNIPKRMVIKYTVRVMRNGILVIDFPFEFTVKIRLQCSYTKLCAVPSTYQFLDILCCEQYETSFDLYNFGEAEINYVLKCINMKTRHECDGLNIQIVPKKGFLEPGASQKIQITLISYDSQLTSCCIRYYIRKNIDSDDLVATDDVYWKNNSVLFTMEYFSYYPTIQIADVAKNTCGPLFTKFDIWRFLNIQEFNQVLRTIKYQETKTIKMCMPDAQFGRDISKRIVLNVDNISPVETTWRIERKKNCNCELKEVKTDGSYRKYSWEDCVHRKEIICFLSSDSIAAHGDEFMYFDLCYHLEGTQTLCFLLHLSNERTVGMEIDMVGLKSGTLSIYSHDFHLPLYDVYLNEICSDYQMFWVYNNTRIDAEYSLDLTILKKYNIQNRHEVLMCINPKGVIKKKKRYPIIFRFRPITVKDIKVKLPMKFGDQNKILIVTGKGSMRYEKPINKYMKDIPTFFAIYSFPGLFVNISHSHLIINDMPTTSALTRMIILKNITSDCDVGYWWSPHHIPNTVNVTAVPSTGVLKSGESCLILIHIETGNHPCCIRVPSVCNLVDKTTLQKHIETKNLYQKQAIDMEYKFELQDTGASFTAPEVAIVPAPKIFQRLVNITIDIAGVADLDIKMSTHDQLKLRPFYQVPVYFDNMIERMLSTKRPKVYGNGRRSQSTMLDYEGSSQAEIRGISTYMDMLSERGGTDCKILCCLKQNDTRFNVIRIVLECLILEILESKRFKNYLKTFRYQPETYYQQYIYDDTLIDQEYNEIKLIVNRIPDTLLSDILEFYIEDTMLTHFKLGAHPFMNDEKEMETGTKRMVRDMYSEKFLFLVENL